MSQIVDDQRIGEIGWATEPAPRAAPLPDALGPALRILREERGLIRKRLAELSDTDPSTITRLERGERGASRESIDRLARALDASPEDHNHLLGAAGFLTDEAVTLLEEPDLIRLSTVLADPLLTPDDRRMLLTYVRLAVAHARARGYGVDVASPEPEPRGPRRGRGTGRRVLQRDRVRGARSS